MNQIKINLTNFIKILLASLSPKEDMRRMISKEKEFLQIQNLQVEINLFKDIKILAIGKSAYEHYQELCQKLCSFGLKGLLGPGLILTKYGHFKGPPPEILGEADHPEGDYNSFRNAARLISFLHHLHEETLLLFCLSGGASSLVLQPPDLIDASTVLAIHKELLRSGATIHEMNALRAVLSSLKDGGVAYESKAKRIITLVFSDVADNDLSVIGGAPTFLSWRPPSELLPLAQRYLPSTLLKLYQDYLTQIDGKERYELYQKKLSQMQIDHVVVSDWENLLKQTQQILNNLGLEKVFIEEIPFNQNIQLGMTLIQQKFNFLRKENPQGCFAYISCGELSISVQGEGQGGRNSHFLAQMAFDLFDQNCLALPEEEREKISFLSLATDGTDGPTEYAGGYLSFSDYQRGQSLPSELGLEECLKTFDTLQYLIRLGRALRPGPTGINLMDLRIIFYNCILADNT